MQNSKSIQKIIIDCLSAYDDVLLVFLFGSVAAGHHSEASDIDLAVLFLSEPDFYYLDEIKNSISRFIKRDIDLVSLNTASPIIRMQVLKKGILLIRKDHAYEEFFTRTVEEYDDIKIMRREIEDNILKGKLYA